MLQRDDTWRTLRYLFLRLCTDSFTFHLFMVCNGMYGHNTTVPRRPKTRPLYVYFVFLNMDIYNYVMPYATVAHQPTHSSRLFILHDFCLNLCKFIIVNITIVIFLLLILFPLLLLPPVFLFQSRHETIKSCLSTTR